MHALSTRSHSLLPVTLLLLTHALLVTMGAGCTVEPDESDPPKGFTLEEPWTFEENEGQPTDMGQDQDRERDQERPSPDMEEAPEDMRPTADASSPPLVPACIRLSPGTGHLTHDSRLPDAYQLEFGAAPIGQTAQKTFEIENCSAYDPLQITALQWADDGRGVFHLVDPSMAEEAISIAPLDTITITIAYSPESEAIDHGQLHLLLAGEEREVTLDVQGKGTNVLCPVAAAEGWVEGSGARPSTEIRTIPLKTVQLQASNSRDPDGSIQLYEWNIISAPIDSGTRLQPSNRVENPRLFIDVAGEYEVELVVYDALGLASCKSSIVTILAAPDEDIHVQLSWDTPSDGDQLDDTGTDLDLHYMRVSPTSKWNNPAHDVYWENPEGDWGIVGDPNDNPSLDIDDTDGKGPENINHDGPETGSFAVGVYYYDDASFGASYATVRIYIEGQLKFEERDRHLPEDDLFWDVASITWPSRRIFIRDRISQGFPIGQHL